MAVGAGDGRGGRRWPYDGRTIAVGLCKRRWPWLSVIPRRWPYVELGEHDGQRWAVMELDTEGTGRSAAKIIYCFGNFFLIILSYYTFQVLVLKIYT